MVSRANRLCEVPTETYIEPNFLNRGLRGSQNDCHIRALNLS